MNSEKKSNSNQRNSKRKIDKIKQVNRTDVEENSTNVEDNSSSSENFQKDLIEVFDKCIELREDESDCPAVNQKLDNSTTEQHYENSKRNNIESTLYHTVNENLDLRKINCPEMNGLPMVNSAESNNCNDSNKNDKEFLESNNNRQDQENGHQLKNDCPIKDTVPINTNAQLTYTNGLDVNNIKIEYKEYESEVQMQDIMKLIQAELSEPYSIYTYRYFIYNWPKLCFLATHGNKYVGAIVCKLDMHMNVVKRGYIAMLAVKKEYRKLKIGTNLVQKAIDAMLADNADEVVLETEMKNVSALRLYENLGFVRDKRLFRYYLNGVDALRLKLWFN